MPSAGPPAFIRVRSPENTRSITPLLWTLPFPRKASENNAASSIMCASSLQLLSVTEEPRVAF